VRPGPSPTALLSFELAFKSSSTLGQASSTLRIYTNEAFREEVDRYLDLAVDAQHLLSRVGNVSESEREQLDKRFQHQRAQFNQLVRDTFQVKRIGPKG
jgi:hypothetical protein